MTVHSHLPGLLRCVLGAFLVLASASAAAAQAEFHYQYGKLTNPFSGAREYTSIPSCPKTQTNSRLARRDVSDQRRLRLGWTNGS